MFCTCKRSDLLVKGLKLVFLKMEAFWILLIALHNNTIICYKQKFKKLFISYVGHVDQDNYISEIVLIVNVLHLNVRTNLQKDHF